MRRGGSPCLWSCFSITTCLLCLDCSGKCRKHAYGGLPGAGAPVCGAVSREAGRAVPRGPQEGPPGRGLVWGLTGHHVLCLRCILLVRGLSGQGRRDELCGCLQVSHTFSLALCLYPPTYLSICVCMYVCVCVCVCVCVYKNYLKN